MNIALSPDGPEFNGQKKSFEQLLKDLQPKLDAIPEELRVPALPPNEDAAAEVQEYIREKMNLPVAETVSNWMLIGNESLERSKIREGRIGEVKGTRAFAFLYPYGKLLRSVCIYPKDGIDPRMIAKGVMWGQLSEVPSSIAHSQIMDIADFFRMQSFDLMQLLDAPLLEKAKAEYRQKFEAEIKELQSQLAQSKKVTPAPRPVPEIVPQSDYEELKVEAVQEQNRAEHWKLFGIIVGAIAAVELIPTAQVLMNWLG
ncbi:MAG: hypothetical protein WCO60_10905 [Verrucomicrobiota bacterium]